MSVSPPQTPAESARSLVWTTRRYVLALSAIAVLTVAAFTALQAQTTAHERILAVVNEAGRQRTLSQYIALYVHRMVADECLGPRAECVRRLGAAVDQFERLHHALTHGAPQAGIPGPTSPQIHALYFDGTPSLDERVRAFVAAARRVLADDPRPPDGLEHPAVRHILVEGPGPLLEALDAVVLAYQRDGEAAMGRLRGMEVGVVLLTLTVLLLEALFIFRPMVRRLTAQFAAIGAFNAVLEGRVEERTTALAAASAEAERANRAKSRFLTAAGHDMLQPLEAAEMVAGMLETEVTSPRAQALVADLRRSQGSLRHLVRSVLEVARLEAGDVRPVVQDVPVGPLLLAVAAELAPLAAGRELRLSVVPTALCVRSDPHLLGRVVRNLVANALRYTPSGGGGVVIGCRRRGPDRVLIQVADSGEGIAAEDQERIFEAFVQVGPGHHDRSEGLGLGLSVVRGLCHLLEHDVMVWSQPGRGSVFSVTCARGAPELRGGPEVRESSAPPGSGFPPPVSAGLLTHEP